MLSLLQFSHSRLALDCETVGSFLLRYLNLQLLDGQKNESRFAVVALVVYPAADALGRAEVVFLKESFVLCAKRDARCLR
jgi:hypothetical protein